MKIMKRIARILLVLAVMASLLAAGYFLRAYRMKSEPQTTEASTTEALATEASTEPVLTVEELVGPWHLAEETNSIFDVFPGAMEFGSTMEIRSNGAIAWYIGADGGAGTYSVDGSVLHCELTNAMDNSPMTMDFTAKRQDGQLFLTTVYRDMELCWRWGEGEAGKG